MGYRLSLYFFVGGGVFGGGVWGGAWGRVGVGGGFCRVFFFISFLFFLLLFFLFFTISPPLDPYLCRCGTSGRPFSLLRFSDFGL